MTLLLTGTSMVNASQNPFFVNSYQTPHETLPFDKVKMEHFLPAFEKGFAQQDKQIKSITSNQEAPTFKNTLEALEYSGNLLHDVSAVFYTLTGSENTDELMALSTKVAAMQTDHSNKLYLNEALFKRIKAVYDQKASLKLNTEQAKLLDETYKSFVLNGAALKGDDRAAYKKLTLKISQLNEAFFQNSLKATNQYEKIITDASLLEGLPEDVIAAARSKAAEKKKEGWLFDLSAPVYSSLMKYLKNRTLREEFYRAYLTRATSGEWNNKSVILELVNARMQLAQLLGYRTYADYALTERMAKTPQEVYQFLDKLAAAYKPVAKEEEAAIQGFETGMEGKYTALEPWDWAYYSEKYKQARFNVS
ncbi:MAG: M3 family metallopeptidase, partial [Bacteroidota bacterium]|nr:M3 family metallopeptidase [Bacteroidota bacterium]